MNQCFFGSEVVTGDVGPFVETVAGDHDQMQTASSLQRNKSSFDNFQLEELSQCKCLLNFEICERITCLSIVF